MDNDIERYPHLKEFLRFIAERLGSAANTIKLYEQEIKSFYEWMIPAKGHNDLRKIVKKDFFTYRDYSEQQGYSHNTLRVKFTAIGNLIGYLIQNEIIPETADPWPSRLHLKGEKRLPHTVPTPSEIFRLRLKRKVRLEWAWHFELTLSSGMRSDEIAQLRAADFNFELRPHDKELGYTSPYFAGSIDLALGKIKTKNNRPRRVYFSQLAGKLTKEMFAKHNITADDAMVPLMVWKRTNAQDWMRLLCKGVIEDAPTVNKEPPVQRDRNFLDIDIDMLNVDEYFKKMLSKRQKDSNGMEEYKRQASQPTAHRQRVLHPHALRHSFTCFMYYRNPMGERNAADSLRLLLGHAGYTELTTYLRDLNLIDNDATWRRLWIGKPQDWAGINR